MYKNPMSSCTKTQRLLQFAMQRHKCSQTRISSNSNSNSPSSTAFRPYRVTGRHQLKLLYQIPRPKLTLLRNPLIIAILEPTPIPLIGQCVNLDRLITFGGRTFVSEVGRHVRTVEGCIRCAVTTERKSFLLLHRAWSLHLCSLQTIQEQYIKQRR